MHLSCYSRRQWVVQRHVHASKVIQQSKQLCNDVLA